MSLSKYTCFFLIGNLLFIFCSNQETSKASSGIENTTLETMSIAEKKEKLLALNQAFEEAMLKADMLWLDNLFADDFLFTHGDGWIKEDAYLAYEDKAETLAAVKKKPFQYRKTANSAVELHDDIAILNGVYNSGMNINGADMNINITYVRVYANRNNIWKLLSHKTVQLIATPITE